MCRFNDARSDRVLSPGLIDEGRVRFFVDILPKKVYLFGRLEVGRHLSLSPVPIETGPVLYIGFLTNRWIFRLKDPIPCRPHLCNRALGLNSIQLMVERPRGDPDQSTFHPSR